LPDVDEAFGDESVEYEFILEKIWHLANEVSL
jgi:hypothetical protein